MKKQLYLKATVAVLFLLFIPELSLVMSQTGNMVSYAYDNAGNRISRKIVPLNSNPSHVKKQADPAPEPVVEKLGEHKITVYPNPTKGSLAVEISGYEEKDPMSISLYDPQGKPLQQKAVKPGKNPVSLTSYPNGFYILRVQAGDKLTEFKIIKQ